MRRLAIAFVAVFGVLLGSPALRAAETPQALRQRLEEYTKLQQELIPLFKDKQYDKAADVCRNQIKVVPESNEAHYNLACCLSRLGQKEEAITELGKAVDLGFTDAAHIREDDDLAPLREQAAFKDLVAKAHDKLINAPHEKGADIAGVKTLEGFPEQGLRYRLRISPTATAKKPARLLIWLHPSGGSMDNVVEQFSPQFAKDGFALLVFTQKNYNFWTGPDAAALMDKTLPEVAKIEGLDAKKPVLLGFSAGGQLALQLWQQHPEAFGGLVLDAAYPLNTQLFAQRKIAPLTLPKSDAIKSCPILALVGGIDGGSNIWRAVEKSWHDAKIPLTLHIVPGKGHTWLIDKTEAATLDTWLKRVAAGELPNEPAATQPAPADGPTIRI